MPRHLPLKLNVGINRTVYLRGNRRSIEHKNFKLVLRSVTVEDNVLNHVQRAICRRYPGWRLTGYAPQPCAEGKSATFMVIDDPMPRETLQ